MSQDKKRNRVGKLNAVNMIVQEHFAGSIEQARTELEWAIEEGLLKADEKKVGAYKPGLRIKGHPIMNKTLLITYFPKNAIDRDEAQTWFMEHASYAVCGEER
jgi:hypothetical protein